MQYYYCCTVKKKKKKFFAFMSTQDRLVAFFLMVQIVSSYSFLFESLVLAINLNVLLANVLKTYGEFYGCNLVEVKGFPSHLFTGDFSLNGDFIGGFHLINDKRYWIHSKQGTLLYWSSHAEVPGGMWVIDDDLDPTSVQAFHIPTAIPFEQWWAFDAKIQTFVPTTAWVECPVCKTASIYGDTLLEGHYVLQKEMPSAENHIWEHSVNKNLQLVHDATSHQYTVLHSEDDECDVPVSIPDTWGLMVSWSQKKNMERKKAWFHCGAASTSAVLVFQIGRTIASCSVELPDCLIVLPLSDGLIYATGHENIRLIFVEDPSVSVRDLPPDLMLHFEFDGHQSSDRKFSDAFVYGADLRMNIPGTHAVNLCLYLGASKHNCLAFSEMTYEVTNSQSYTIHSTGNFEFNEAALSIFNNECRQQDRRINLIFLADGRNIDGVKMSIFHLMQNLPHEDYNLSTLDLTCDQITENHSFHHLQKGAGINTILHCSTFEKEDFTAEELENAHTFVYQHFRTKDDWEQVDPRIQKSFEKLLDTFWNVDVLVLSNAGRDSLDAVAELARLAGVRNILLDVGALGPTETLRTDSVTGYIAQSQYVAMHPDLTSKRRPIFLLHPVVNSVIFSDEYVLKRCTGQKTGEVTKNNPGIFSVGFVGRLSQGKSPGMFIRAISQLQRLVEHTEISVHGTMIGNGLLKPYMERLSANLNASVTFIDFINNEDLPCYMRNFDTLIMPSLYPEAFGMVIIEAMLLGIPPISFGAGGTAEYLWHGETGLLLKNKIPRSLVDAIHLLIKDSNFKKRLGVNARFVASTHLSLNQTILQYHKTFKTITFCRNS